jgi:DNA-binding NarL/FixJ family response regulator
MNIYLVDDNDDFRKTLTFFLEDYLSHKVVGESNDGKEFLERDDIFADIILMDINMPGINGIQATKMGTWKNHEYKIIAVSQYKENVDLHQLISAGFKGFVSKVNLFRDLENAIITVNDGKLFFPDEINFSKKKS